MHHRLLFFLLPVLACSSVDHGPGSDSARAGEQDLVKTSSTQDPLGAIARLEDARSDGSGMLELLLQSEETRVRARAATALGRLPTWRYRSEVTDALVRALDDEQAEVRASAAFALGMRADIAAADGLLGHRADADATVRARIVEAASKLATAGAQKLVLDALSDPERAVRIEAAEGVQRFPADVPDGAPSREQVDMNLLAFWRRMDLEAGGRSQVLAAGEKNPRPDALPDPETDEELWRALSSLARRKSAAARDVYLEVLRDDSGASRWSRFFALKGLAELAPEAREDTAFRRMLGWYARETDWVLVCEALKGLGRIGNPDSLDALHVAWMNGKVGAAHVRTAVIRALASMPVETSGVAQMLERARRDESREVRAAAIVAQCTRLAKQSAELQEPISAELATLAEDEDAVLRRAVALGAAELSTPEARAVLLRLTRDPSFFVSTAATSALERHPSEETSARLRELLLGEDNGLRLSSAEVLEKTRATVAFEDLSEAWRMSTGDIGSEGRVQLLRLANVQAAGEARLAFVLAGMSDPDPYVRRIAHELATAMGSDALLPAEVSPPRGDVLQASFTRASPASKNPIVDVETTRGTLTFELFPAEAPQHVASFLELAARDHYDGLTFHRVELGFVVQGGCHRGDGNGGGTARGAALRHEIGPRKYIRGSLGMPRNDDLESGGSQFFVTHVPTPHLDGRYTIFGELRSGFDVLDSIEVGDKILDVRSR
jgi:cyclophilin family peptidyl-prolyl cis-trans isomerase/HEAT repeat protein